VDSATNQIASPLAYGAGHVQPNRAADPGLIYDLTVDDYLNFLCSRGYNQTLIKVFSGKPYLCPKSFSVADFNYPSIAVPNLGTSPVTVTRTVTNVGSPNTSYQVRVSEPAGVSVSVTPTKLTFKAAGEKQTFKVTLKPKGQGVNEYVFGFLIWSDGKHYVRSPVAVSGSSSK
jgi:hypothetical protein